MAEHVIILLPNYNDDISLGKLLPELSQSLQKLDGFTFSILIVDDGSVKSLSLRMPLPIPAQILHLQRNIGHQKAIAVALAYIKDSMPCDKVLVMDADGEDRPVDAVALLQSATQNPGQIIFAKRKSRQEAFRFRFFYRLYKLAFAILTGKKISFGNFLVMPKPLLNKAVYYSEIWNHIAGGILKAGLPYTSIVTDRGKRYEGKSKMSFTSLLIHGFGAIAVFVEVIASRLLLFSLLMIGISIVAILALVGIRSFTNLAIPGWTSTVVAAMLIILLQSFLLSLFTIFLYLSSQSQRKFIPAHHYKDYTGSLETIQ